MISRESNGWSFQLNRIIGKSLKSYRTCLCHTITNCKIFGIQFIDNIFTEFYWTWCTWKNKNENTLLLSQSKWSKDKPFLLMYSRHARKLDNSKIKKNFWNCVDAFWDNPIYPPRYLNKHLDGTRSTSKILFILGSYKFLACLEYISRNGLSFGHSDWRINSVVRVLICSK